MTLVPLYRSGRAGGPYRGHLADQFVWVVSPLNIDNGWLS